MDDKNLFNFEDLGIDLESVRKSIANRLVYSTGKDYFTATPRDWFSAIAYVVRDHLMARWMETMRHNYRLDTKRVYYLSLEFLIGRTMTNSLLNMHLYEVCREAMNHFGFDLDSICREENDAALGNGGLGRLAACFLDSMATLSLAGYGYGIRYEYGMFDQEIDRGQQVENPDNWLRFGNPWEFPRPEVIYPVKFYGRVVQLKRRKHNQECHWVDAEEVMAMAYDTPVPGYDMTAVNNLRLWSAKSSNDFDLQHFNEGHYIKAVEEKNSSENLSKVLYPDDTTDMGKELRLKQQYFFVSASLQDILRRFRKYHQSFNELPHKVAIQLNDTHPAIAIPELMRLLVDEHGLDFKHAWDITQHTFSYTNHTLLPEALETWPVDLMETMLPRHTQIIFQINHNLLRHVKHHHPGDRERMRRMSLIDDGEKHRVRMAHLAFVGSHKINGVAKIHTQLMRDTLFKDFDELFPDRIVNLTNGITPRRWLNQANQPLSKYISALIGDTWRTDLNQLSRLKEHAANPDTQQQFAQIKQHNKTRLAQMIQDKLNITVNIYSMFDVHIKRIHEYKRQLLNILHVITLYNRCRRDPSSIQVPRTIIFGGKAAPGYRMAKWIIRLIHDVAEVVNNDPQVGDLLKVVFIPNYNVSNAEIIIPACDLSEQISTAGTEASGTGNMKFALNGALTIGTLDGANVEIREEVGEENIFIFGLTAPQVNDTRQNYNPWEYVEQNNELKNVLHMIGSGYFSPEEPHRFQGILDSLNTDYFMLMADYAAYVTCQQEVEFAYLDKAIWQQKAILNVAGMGKFSSDRTVTEYAKKVWNVQPVGDK